MEKLGDPAERLWYARQAAEHGWSHNILVLQIGGRAHERQGKAITNLRDTLPPAELSGELRRTSRSRGRKS